MKKSMPLEIPVSAIVVMGVSGSGKSTIGEMLAAELAWTFHDGDHYHPEANVEKQRKGIPLDDNDREAWLEALYELIADNSAKGSPIVLACSALKRKYRAVLANNSNKVMFVYLQGDMDTIGERLAERKGHFMNPNLLTNQFADLEEPRPDEALHIDIAPEPENIVDSIIKNIEAGRIIEFS